MKQLCPLLISVAVLIGCGSSVEQTITISRGGGVSGASTGYSITSEGKVSKWQQLPSEEAKATDLFSTTDDSAAFFFRFLDEMGFRQSEYSTSGNMTSTIEVDSAGKKHSVRWGLGDETAPPVFQSFYDLLTNYIQRRTK